MMATDLFVPNDLCVRPFRVPTTNVASGAHKNGHDVLRSGGQGAFECGLQFFAMLAEAQIPQ